jgi:hypothetical protein
MRWVNGQQSVRENISMRSLSLSLYLALASLFFTLTTVVEQINDNGVGYVCEAATRGRAWWEVVGRSW